MSVKRLLKITSSSLVNPDEYASKGFEDSLLHVSLIQMLLERNGFLALKSLVYICPLSGNRLDDEYNIKLWNAPNLWKDNYSGAADNILCFDADLFGNQYCVMDNKIYLFDAETAELEYMADTLGEWAAMIIKDDYWSGHSRAQEWQASHGSVQSNNRLLPKTPFILGGEFKLDNLYSCEHVQSIKYRGDMYVQMRDLIDGTQIQFEII